MTATKQKVTIKGRKEGLVFFMDDSCTFDDLMADLREKIEHSHSKILSGPLIRVTIHLGKRYCSPEQIEDLTQIIRQKGNLVIHTIDSDVISKEEAFAEMLKDRFAVEVRNVRNGQVIDHEGDLLLLGDVNPGAIINCTGSIFVLGHLRGIAHAGVKGDKQAIIAAASLEPTQLRIADVISRPGEEWAAQEGTTEFAYLEEEKMIVAKMNHLTRVRPELGAKRS